ncbi:methyl-accepting chemotaxis protein [Argonema galeatum]|uniref:methyl-accepting chemotaxis protein n=1 Tax=Argonema galeatum TaxID=2942762 RepID=UPI0030846F0D
MLLGYSVPILLFIGLVGIVYSNANKLASVFRQVEITQENVETSNTLTLTHSRMVIDLRGYLLTQNPLFSKEYEEELNSFNDTIDRAETTIKNAQQKQRLKEMILFKTEYDRYAQNLINLVKQGKTAQALSIFRTGQGQKFVDKLRNLSAEFNTAEKGILNAATAEAKTLLNSLIAAVGVGALLCLAFSLLAAYWISSGITNTIDRAASAIATSSNEIAATVEEQERNASQQAASVNQTTTTMDELGASSQQAAGQAQAVAAAAQQVLVLTASGTEAVEDSLEGMSVLRQKVGAIALEISRLSDQTNQIRNISSLVSDLANQTNMLALNAAVEAVRAGEHGKGFGVVASEIRKLADQSKKSAEKINTLVADIQKAINSTVRVTDEGTKTVEESVKIAQKTAEAFTGVTEAINNVVLSSQQISLSAKQQAIAIQQVVDAMNLLNHAAAQTASGISQTRIGTQKLNDAAHSLKKEV